MRRNLRIGSLLAFALLGATQAHADGAPGFFFRGRPLPACRDFMLTEFGVGYAMSGAPISGNGRVLTSDVGYMRNISLRSAIGITAHITSNDGGRSQGFKLRYRRWIPDPSGRPGSVSVEFGAGLMVGGNERLRSESPGWHAGQSVKYPFPVASVSLNAADYASVMLQLEPFSNEAGDSTLRSTMTLRLGSYAVLIAGIGLAVAAGIALATMGPMN